MLCCTLLNLDWWDNLPSFVSSARTLSGFKRMLYKVWLFQKFYDVFVLISYWFVLFYNDRTLFHLNFVRGIYVRAKLSFRLPILLVSYTEIQPLIKCWDSMFDSILTFSAWFSVEIQCLIQRWDSILDSVMKFNVWFSVRYSMFDSVLKLNVCFSIEVQCLIQCWDSTFDSVLRFNVWFSVEI